MDELIQQIEDAGIIEEFKDEFVYLINDNVDLLNPGDIFDIMRLVEESAEAAELLRLLTRSTDVLDSLEEIVSNILELKGDDEDGD